MRGSLPKQSGLSRLLFLSSHPHSYCQHGSPHRGGLGAGSRGAPCRTGGSEPFALRARPSSSSASPSSSDGGGPPTAAFGEGGSSSSAGGSGSLQQEREGASGNEGGVVVPVRRASRLTGSQLANALGWWKGGREQVWEEKLGLREPFRGNDATRWGTKHEPRARDDFEELTGLKVHDAGKEGLALLDKEAGGLVRLHREEGKTWLGAAPDGIILPQTDSAAGDAEVATPDSSSSLLEIKCPYNRGFPRDMKPWQTAPWYYMAQVQSLMEIFDMDSCHFYCWTIEHGSCLYMVERDREYWQYVYCALEEFWHKNLVPAREILLDSGGMDVAAALEYKPREIHMLTEYTKILSQRMANSLEVKPMPNNLKM